MFHYKQNLSLFETSCVFAGFGLGELASLPILSELVALSFDSFCSLKNAALLAGQIKCWLLLCVSMVFLTLYGAQNKSI